MHCQLCSRSPHLLSLAFFQAGNTPSQGFVIFLEPDKVEGQFLDLLHLFGKDLGDIQALFSDLLFRGDIRQMSVFIDIGFDLFKGRELVFLIKYKIGSAGHGHILFLGGDGPVDGEFGLR